MNWITKLRGVAILAVLMIHVTFPLLYRNPDLKWWAGNMFDGMSRFAVPLFLMISGAMLLHKEESIKSFFQKRAGKILLPFVVWSVIYFLYKSNGHFDPKLFVTQILGAKIYYHLWYFYILIPLYLFIPFIRKVVHFIPTSYILCYSIISSSILTINDILGLSQMNLMIFTNPFSSGVSYLLLGYAITRRDYELKHFMKWGIISFLVIIFGTYFTTIWKGSFSEAFYDALGLPVMLYTIMIFILGKKLFKEESNTLPNKLLTSISTYSFGIYLVHPMLLNENIQPYSFKCFRGQCLFYDSRFIYCSYDNEFVSFLLII
ncbi:acyltransferase family protein [[Brevibacterium] frigoritolerans]|nr:acyltransferase family protein [Peribacillus frigoritolerans]